MALTGAALLERARALAPTLASRARVTEQQRAPHDESIRDLIEAEIPQLLVPRRWGGHELGLEAMLEVVEVLSASCMSTGWIAAFYIGHNLLAARLSEKAQAEIFADRPFCLMPAATAPTVQAREVPGGYELTGRTPWGSGVMHADWVLMGGLTAEMQPLIFVLPIDDIEVVDTWHMSGMAGTGSNDMVVDGAFVPTHRVTPMIAFADGETDGAKIHPNPIYRMPLMPFVQCESLGVFTGGLRGATTAFDEALRVRVRGHTLAAVREHPLAHLQLGTAQVHADVGGALAHEHVRMARAYLEGPGFDMADRVRLRGHAGFIVDHCRRSVNELMGQSSSGAFHADLPLQRIFRDMNMLATHAFFDWDTSREQVGRFALGLDPTTPLL